MFFGCFYDLNLVSLCLAVCELTLRDMIKTFFQWTTKRLFPDDSSVLEQCYQQQVIGQKLQYDEAQVIILQSLQNLLDSLVATVNYQQRATITKYLLRTPEPCRSLYLFGEVGRGKSMLMTLFYEKCPFQQKRRVHFNVFMLEVHAFIHEWHRQARVGNVMQALAKKIRSSLFLLCIDEFHVTDIADAMIMERLFNHLFNSGLIVVITSNRHPDDLYQGGLQRAQFLIFTQLLLRVATLVKLEANNDYRQTFPQASELSYIFPLNRAADDFVQQHYQRWINLAPLQGDFLEVLGRKVVLTARHDNIALASFEQLCEQALGSVDYLEMAKQFKVVILEGIPKLSADKRNEAKRFMSLIDTFYEHKVKLICTAEVSPQDIYIEGDGAFEFRRTSSRLIEMQSAAYLNSRS
jgi:cell division protein ZapE